MRSRRNLEQTPGLIDADVADDIRSVHAGVSVAAVPGCVEGVAEIVDRGPVEHGVATTT